MTDRLHEKSELERRLEAKLAAAAVEHEHQPDSVSKDQFDAIAAERDDLKDQLLRHRAEFDNYRKRIARDAERVRSTAAEGIILDLLPVLDHLVLALQHADDASRGLAQGVDMVLNQFQDALARHGLERIPTVGVRFDPHVHEAVMQRDDLSQPVDTVIEEFQAGYRLGDKILRPAKVVVSTGGPQLDRSAQSTTSEPFQESDGAEAAASE